MSFQSLGLHDALLQALLDIGYAEPTPIQVESIPLALAGRDLIAGAQTGTGKTAAFALPLLQRLGAHDAAAAGPRALILTPTRELAAQVHERIQTYGQHSSLRVAVIFGGVGMNPQTEALERGVDVLVATPGRLLDHLDQGHLDLAAVSVLVLDEADRMLDMGFLPDIERILRQLPAERQTLLYSATFPQAIRDLARDFMREPAEVQATPANSVAHSIRHRVYRVDKWRKRELLLKTLSSDPTRQALIFTRTKFGANKLAHSLQRAGMKSLAIHGNKSQGARTRALAEFKSGEVTFLVATDIAARGLDIAELPLVVNYDLPQAPEDYIHRIGRTGRKGMDGEAISLMSPDDDALLAEIQKLLSTPIEMETPPGFELGSVPPPEPREPRPRAEHASRVSAEGEAAEGEDAEENAAPADPAAAQSARPEGGRRRRRRRGRGGKPGAQTGAQNGAPREAAEGVAEGEAGNAPPRPPRAPRPPREARESREPREQRRGRQARSNANPNPRPPTSDVDFDEQQPTDYRDQWTADAVGTDRPAWTYLEHHEARGTRDGRERSKPGAPRPAGAKPGAARAAGPFERSGERTGKPKADKQGKAAGKRRRNGKKPRTERRIGPMSDRGSIGWAGENSAVGFVTTKSKPVTLIIKRKSRLPADFQPPPAPTRDET